MPSKKDKKNARENGGIAAAVTRQAAGKFSNTSTSSVNNPKSDSASSASSPPINTPEIRPSLPQNANLAVSPMLDALSGASVTASTPPSMANDWIRNGMAGSPGNLISFMGESPPTQPSSYEEYSRLHQAWPIHRPFVSPAPASPSPPSSIRRPLSFQMEAQYQSPDGLTQGPAAGYRRSSLHSQLGQGRQPPLPHQPQAHFYGMPDLDLMLTPQSGMKAGQKGYHFGFDKLPSPHDGPSGSDDVVLAGFEGGLNVLSVTKHGLEPYASLKALRGGVRFAKILPWTIDGDMAYMFPLVAVVLHGPVLGPATSPELTVQEGAASPRPDSARSPRPGFAHPSKRSQFIECYQTSVHIYSLRTSKLVDVLLQAQKQPMSSALALANPVIQPPAPAGAFSIKADGGTIIVSSGITGESWVYLQLLESQNSHLFACVGKLWTSLQHSYRSEVTEEGERSQAVVGPNPQTPIIALNGRWIAYCPPSPSSQITMRAHIPVPILGKAPGVSSVTPPSLPPVTAPADQPTSDSVVNKIMRETTQELIQGAKWVGQQGLQAWNSYWTKPVDSTQPSQQARSPPQQLAGARSAQQEASNFPPTHGTSGQTLPKDPGLVSILDAEVLATSSSPHHLTTFTAPLGCSFLAFSPTSLSLFTASTKGDVQTVWDLLRIQHTRSSPLQTVAGLNDPPVPHVRQIAQFSRMTVARIVDVAWTGPHGERIAMVTERGTVHLLDMPFSAFIWPPPRRRKPVQDTTADAGSSNSAVAIASGALGAAYQAAKPFVTRSRSASSSTPAVTSNTLRDSATHGGRVIAASISSSLGRTGTAINQLRHTGENRISLPPSSTLPDPSCVTWIKTRKSYIMFAIGDGLVRSFPSKTRRASAASAKRLARGTRYVEFKVPLLPSETLPPAIQQILEMGVQEEDLDLSDRELDGGNTMTLDPRPVADAANHGEDSAIPHAEIESSAPYQPFHTDRRVTLAVYSQTPYSNVEGVTAMLDASSIGTASSKKKKSQPTQATLSSGQVASTWAFGGPISAVKLDMGLPPIADDEPGSVEDHRALPSSEMERVMQYGEGEQENIVVTTRRRRRAQATDRDDDGFFEDDCEVLDFADQRV